MKQINRILILLAGAGLLASCSNVTSGLRGITSGAGLRSAGLPGVPAAEPPKYSLAKTICNPLDDNFPIAPSATTGLKGKLYYLSSTMPRYTSVEQIASSIDTETDLFLSDVNVPTRMFDRGFPLANGNLIQVGGSPLTEWFGMVLDAKVKLALDDPEGLYQFAIIADDGATMEIIDGDSTTMHVNDDGTHSSRLACASTAMPMAGLSRIPIRLKYYQGPRTEIALMLLWRKVSSNQEMSEPLCGATGQNLFFEYHNNPSTPQAAYLELQSRGWQPLKPENFEIPSQDDVNPCITDLNWMD